MNQRASASSTKAPTAPSGQPQDCGQLFVRGLGDDASFDVQRGGGKGAPVPFPHFLGGPEIAVHINQSVGYATMIEKSSRARCISAPVGSVDGDVWPGATFLADRGAGQLFLRLIIFAHEETTDAVAHRRDIHLVAIAGADELAILHGIAGALLSRTIGPAKGVRLPPYPPDNSLPDVPAGVQPVGAGLCVAPRHPPRPVCQILQALAGVGRGFHTNLTLLLAGL